MPRPLLQVISADHRRGAEISAVDLRDELRRRGTAAELVALRRSGAPNRLDVPTLADRRFAGVAEVRRRARASRGVLAHGSDALPAAYLATRGTGVPFVYRSIGDPRFWSARLDRRLRVGVELRAARAVVATFEGAAEGLVADHHLQRERVHVIPNGRPLDRFVVPTPAERRAARQALDGLDPDAPLLVFLGALSHEKAPERAVEVVAQLPDHQLVVAGAGPRRELVEAYADAVAPGRVRLVGPTTDPAAVLRAADVVLLPSRSEGFPGVAVEAGLTGVPVVATDVGAARDVIEHGTTGFVAAGGDVDELAALVTQAGAGRETLGRAARERCARLFSLDAVADRWQALLDRVLP